MSSHVDKYPTGFGQTPYPKYRDRMMFTARDCTANARGYGAKHAYMYNVAMRGPLWKQWGNDWLLYLHDGAGFNDADDVEQGCKWSRSREVALSLYGQGLKKCCGSLVSNLEDACLIIASKCKDGTFACYRAYPGPRRTWHIEKIDIKADLVKICGSKTFGKFNVFYMFCTSPGSSSSFNYLKIEDLNMLSFMSDMHEDPDFDLQCGEKQLGRDDYEPKRGKTTKQWVNIYSSIDSARTSGGEGTQGRGAHQRVVCGQNEYLRRFVAGEAYDQPDHRFTIPCDPFRFRLSADPDICIEISEAYVDVYPFPGHKFQQPDGAKPNYYTSLRSGTTRLGRPFKQYSADNAGDGVSTSAYLYVSYLAKMDSPDEKERSAYFRFMSNSLNHRAAGHMMTVLGLPYATKNKFERISGNLAVKPFVVLGVRIVGVGKRFTSNGTVEEVNCTPSMFENSFNAQSDFTWDKTICNTLMTEACVAAKSNVPDELRDVLAEMYPATDQEFIPLGRGPSGPPAPPNPPVPLGIEVYDLDETVAAGSPVLLKTIPAGGSRLTLVWDTKQGHFVDISDISVHDASTRGVEFSSLDVKTVPFLDSRYTDAIDKIVEKLGAKK